MNYQRQYDTIINNATQENRKKNKEVYYEEHHIVPRCLNGSDEKSNKVLLTAREHFIVHKLLTLIYPHNSKIALAFHMITFDKNLGRKVSARDYEYARTICRKALLGNKNGNYGKKLSKEHLDKMIEGRRAKSERDKKEKELWKQIDRFFHPGIRHKQTAEEKKLKIIEWNKKHRPNKGRKKYTKEEKQIMSIKMKDRWNELIQIESFKKKHLASVAYSKSDECKEKISRKLKETWENKKKNGYPGIVL